MKMSELYQFMQENGGSRVFFRYFEVADEVEEAGEDRELSDESLAFYIAEDEPQPMSAKEEKEDASMELVVRDGKPYADSREVAEMVDKRHADLCRDIERYINVLGQNAKLRSDDFFVESSYKTGTGKNYKCYLLTKKGCDMVANKMTGEKGVLFTATYVNQFYELEAKLKAQQQPKTQIDILVESAKALQTHERELARLKLTQEEQAESLRVVNARMDTLNGVCIEGTKRQKFVAMVQKYAISNGLAFKRAWHDFHKAYNTAFHTNLKNSMRYYCEKQGLKKISTPDFLERKAYLDDAMRIMDKLLANGKVLLN